MIKVGKAPRWAIICMVPFTVVGALVALVWAGLYCGFELASDYYAGVHRE